MDWFGSEFGADRLHGEVVLPTDEYFPGAYRGSREDVRAVLNRLCAHMDIDPDRVELELDPPVDDGAELSAHVPLNTRSTGAAGHHRVRGERSVIGIGSDLARRPVALVATIAH